MKPPGLDISGLTLAYGAQTLFRDLALGVPAGRFMVMLGASGVGKSSLLRVAAGLASPMAGCVTATDGQLLQGRIAWMGQQDLLYPWLTILDNVMLGARLRRQQQDRRRALDLLERVGLGGRAGSLPAELSGGMRQRAALARTLYEDRPIVLMDEPFSALDSITRTRVQDLAAGLLVGRTVLMITHDPLEACRMGQLLVVLSGTPATLTAPVALAGDAPRPPDDAEVLRMMGRLLRVLSAAA
ncbi:ABC transporter ATP-binding protein [Lichenicoccus sp.]|uniref:ABC transporter ATP-binding protein n=1 Tax=Lichenicoccus sp. TaxID=2781899 RepID=UPI003D1443C8